MTTNSAQSEENLCRLCLTDDGVVCPIFGSETSSLAQKIYECTTIEIEHIEGVPSAICEVCKSKLIICSQFIIQCLKTDEKIRELYAKQFEQHEKCKQEQDEEIEIINLVTCNETADSNTITVEGEDGGKVFIEVIEGIDTEDQRVLLEEEQDESSVLVSIADESPKEGINEQSIAEEKHPRRVTKKKQNLAVTEEERKLPDNNEEAEFSQVLTQIEWSHGVKKYKKECPICGILQQNLKQHMIVHTGAKNHVCEYCNKGFSQRGNLNTHLRIHTGNKPHKCSQCDKSFGDPTALKIHMVCHSGEKKFSCEICNTTFKYRHSLQSHIRSHNNDRRFSCDICGKAFITSSVLKRHIRHHTGERPYQCAQCFKNFASSGNLSAHQKTHKTRSKINSKISPEIDDTSDA